MAITTAICKSFKLELVQGVHNFLAAGDVFKIALYTSGATLNADTTVYSTTDEITGAGYVAGGIVLTSVNPVTSGDKTVLDFADAAWPAATFTTGGALIYNSTDGNKAVCAIGFGTDKTVANGTLTVVFPAATIADAIIRLN